jgi:hypothetical protein
LALFQDLSDSKVKMPGFLLEKKKGKRRVRDERYQLGKEILGIRE